MFAMYKLQLLDSPILQQCTPVRQNQTQPTSNQVQEEDSGATVADHAPWGVAGGTTPSGDRAAIGSTSASGCRSMAPTCRARSATSAALYSFILANRGFFGLGRRQGVGEGWQRPLTAARRNAGCAKGLRLAAS